MEKIISTDFPGLSCEFRPEELMPEGLKALSNSLEIPIKKYGVWIVDEARFEKKYANYFPQLGLFIKPDNRKSFL